MHHAGDACGGWGAILTDPGPVDVHVSPSELARLPTRLLINAVRMDNNAQAVMKAVLLPVQQAKTGMGCTLYESFRRRVLCRCIATFDIMQELPDEPDPSFLARDRKVFQ